MGLTVGQHDHMLWRQDEAMRKISLYSPLIAEALRGEIVLKISKELHDMGKISDEEYVDDLLKIGDLMQVHWNIKK